MSNPAAPGQPAPAKDPASGLIFAAVDQLAPLFQNYTSDRAAARKMAISAIAAYEPESRADFVNAARTIAFSMAALALLKHAASDDMPMAEKMRAYGRANTLNRSADQSEAAMMRRRRDQRAHPPAALPDWMHADTQTEAQEPFDDTAMRAAVAEALDAAYGTAAPKQAEPRTPAEPKPPATASGTAKPVPNPAPTPAAPPDQAIRYNPLHAAIAEAQKTTFKDMLSQNAAMPQMPGQGTNQRAA